MLAAKRLVTQASPRLRLLDQQIQQRNSMSSLTKWDRLVRYVSSTDGKIRYGEPIVEGSKPDIDQLAQDGKLKVKVLDGPNPWSVESTGEEDSVKSLLGPLTPDQVPIIRCVGLNYKTHSMQLDNQHNNTSC